MGKRHRNRVFAPLQCSSLRFERQNRRSFLTAAAGTAAAAASRAVTRADQIAQLGRDSQAADRDR
jgi:hypothetical protein